MDDPIWFTESWALKVRDATRKLVRLYASAVETVDTVPKWFWVVRLSGLRGGMRPLIVAKPLLRDAVIDHIKRVLEQTRLLRVRAFVAARPLPEKSRLGIKATAAREKVEEATRKRDEYLARQQKIAALLDEASKDVKELLEALGADPKTGQRSFKVLLRAARRFLPFLWAGVVISQFGRLAGQPQFQVLAFFFGTAVIYHLAAWLTLPFHDAGERKYVFFEGYMGRESDGLNPLFPPASRYEDALFKLFGSKPPIVISWETVVPILHYGLMSILLVVMLVKLPFDHDSLAIAALFSAVLITVYVLQLGRMRTLLGLRYKRRSSWEILAALFSSLNIFKSDDSEDGESKEDSDDGEDKTGEE
jgi:hypothetical protein